MRVNLDSPFHLSRLVLPGMIEHRFGRIVYTSSTAGLVAEPAGSAYNSSKHGLLGLMRSVAVDGGPYGITSNAVLPGWVRTEMAERSARQEAKDRGITTEQVWEERAALYPAGRVATPQEVAEMIAFLASEESSGVSGEAIRVALGGWY
jgi:NAD(P)-dependent dehydrogenase (short-subunit alcohol dehydrogenase family)